MASESLQRKVIVIGLDGADPALLEKWGQEGSLPRVRALMQRCARLAVRGVAPFGDGVFWPSFFTCVGPAKHGRYFRIRQAPATYDWMLFNDDEHFAREPLWQIASAAGRRVAIVDARNAPLVRNLNGVQLVDWIVHDRSGSMRSWPTDLAADVSARFGTDPNGGTTESAHAGHHTRRTIETLTAQLAWRIETKTRLCVELLEQSDWDLVIASFQEAHDIGHLAWHVHDEMHPLHESQGIRSFDPVKDVYIALDAAVGALIERAGDGATIVLLAGLGMGPKSTGNFHLDEILRNIERGERHRSYLDIARNVYRMLPQPLRARLKPAAAKTESAARTNDRRHRKFYAVPHNENAGAVRINLKGREPAGRVSPGREYDELCEHLSAKLKTLINVDTGGPAVDSVVKTADQFAGPCLDRLPDLLVLWNRSAPIHALRGPGIRQTPHKIPGVRTGDHVYRAGAFIAGPGIEAAEWRAPVSIMDLGATVADWLGVAVPDADGASIARALSARS
jgi:predicted AlkP superfamily phosphohydrolase/phosphomutase